jgi:hypothetical protein
MSKKIIFKINKEGNVLIDKVEGYGSNCKDFTRLLEKSLGTADESSRQTTDEFYASTETDNQEHIQH